MNDVSLLLAFVAAATVLTLTPGVDTLIVLRTVVAQGRAPAVRAALGVVTGCLIWGAMVALGLGALLRSSPAAYDAVKMMGALYLVWMGARLLRRPRRALDEGQDDAQDDAQRGGTSRWQGAFASGLFTNLLNPKVGVFYVSFLPPFVPEGADVATSTFFLVCVHGALSLAWFGVLIAAASPLSRWLRQPSALVTLDRLTGGVFLAFGVKLAASSAP